MQFKKYYLLILFFERISAKTQVISGKILADTTNRPGTATIITATGHQTSSDSNSEFRIGTSGVIDTVKVFALIMI
jgi:hypothetical protein